MPDNKYIPKLDIAIQHLTVALRLYFETEEYYSVIHLARAAQEIMRQYLEGFGEDHPDQSLLKASIEIADAMGIDTEDKDTRKQLIQDFFKGINDPSNAVKHMNSLEDSVVTFNPHKEAFDMIDRAISYYYTLLNIVRMPTVTYMDEFNKHKRELGY